MSEVCSSEAPASVPAVNGLPAKITFDEVLFRQYEGEQDLQIVMDLIDNELSEPYSIFTYRYFLQQWPHLCWLAFDGKLCFGVVVCKEEPHNGLQRGYIAMLVVTHQYRGLGIGLELVKRCIQQMIEDEADEVVLEAEITNKQALSLYQKLGFVRDKRLHRYYLSGNDAFRLKLMLPLSPERQKQLEEEQKAMQTLANLNVDTTGHQPSVTEPAAGETQKEPPKVEQVIAHGIPEAVIEKHIQDQGHDADVASGSGSNSLNVTESEARSHGGNVSSENGRADVASAQVSSSKVPGQKMKSRNLRKSQNKNQRQGK